LGSGSMSWGVACLRSSDLPNGARITQAYENPGTAQYDPADYQLQYVNNFLMTRTPTNPAGAAEIFDYDDFGNQISQTGSDPSTNPYDAASHPASTTKGGATASFTYDGLGRMATRTEGLQTTLFFHDGSADQISVEKNPAGQVTTSYLLDADRTPVGQDVNGVRAWYVSDPRGNLTQLLDDSAGVQAVFGYDPYGKTKDNLTHTDKPSGWDSRLRFQMAPRDPKTGNYNLGSRLLDPAINRFVGADFYAASSANVDLQLDPLTGNRHMYAGQFSAWTRGQRARLGQLDCRQVFRAVVLESRGRKYFGLPKCRVLASNPVVT
jgi:RHS repeat-associated protein